MKVLRRTPVLRVGAVGLVSVALATTLALGPLRPAEARSGDDQAPPSLVESPDCDRSEPPATTSVTESADPNSQVITVTVPAVAILRLDAHGRVVTALTNTGCAPRRGDQVWLVSSGGTYSQLTGNFPTSHRWIGDFRERGVQVAQRHGDESPLANDDHRAEDR